MTSQPEKETPHLDLGARELIQEAGLLNFLQRYQEALTAYDQAIALNPNNLSVFHSKAGLLRFLKRSEEAIAVYNQILALAPGEISALYFKANTLNDLKRYEEALQSMIRLSLLIPILPLFPISELLPSPTSNATRKPLLPMA